MSTVPLHLSSQAILVKSNMHRHCYLNILLPQHTQSCTTAETKCAFESEVR